MLISRRTFLRGTLASTATGTSLGGYALAEPFRLRVTRYQVLPRGWPTGLRVRLALVADLHIIEPWMGLSRLRQIVARTNALSPDAVLLLGDYEPSSGMQKWARRVGGGEIPQDDWAGVLGSFSAPFGIHAVLGNHDWWASDLVQRLHTGPAPAAIALERAGVTVHENTAARFEKDGQAFWIAGLGDQWAFYLTGRRPRRFDYIGVDDLPGTLEQVTDDAPVVLMAHEPDIFADMGRADMGEHGRRVALTVSGHTHGGQVQFAGYRPIVPSRYGTRYAYGHIVEDHRHLVVSAGLGCSGLPIRFGAPPEIVLVELGVTDA